MIMKMRGVILVMFGIPLVLNVGISRGLVPGFQLVLGNMAMIWLGYTPLSPIFGRMQPQSMPLFMLAFTVTSLSRFDDGMEGDLVAHGPGIGGDDDEPSDPA